jgi:hypothetical protein
MSNQHIHIGGSVTGKNVAVGSHITISESGASPAELAALIGTLRTQLEQAPLPAATKEAIVEEVLPELAAAPSAPEPKTKIEAGLSKLNLLLRGAGAATEQVTAIAQSAGKIAKAAGLAFATVAPWLAKLF